MSRIVTLTVQSAQKLAEYGQSGLTVTIPGGAAMNDEQLNEAKKERRAQQAVDNAEYKRKIAAGEEVVRRWQPGPKLGGVARGRAAAVDGIANAAADLRQQMGELRAQVGQLPIQAPVQIPIVAPIIRGERTPFELKLDKGTGNTVFLVGATKRGKSTALMKIYERYYSDKEIISTLWTDNPQIKLYRHHKNLIVGDRWTDESEKIVEEQHRIQVKTKNHYRFLNMLDDILNLRYSMTLNKMMLTYRNAKMSTIVSIQDVKLFQKCGRANVTNALLFGAVPENVEGIIRCYLTGYLKKIGIVAIADQINWYDEHTADHAFIYVRPATGEVSFHRFNL